jgi:hypothetical protein
MRMEREKNCNPKIKRERGKKERKNIFALYVLCVHVSVGMGIHKGLAYGMDTHKKIIHINM